MPSVVRRSRTRRTFVRRGAVFSVEWATLDASTITRSDSGRGPVSGGRAPLGVSRRLPRRGAVGRTGRGRPGDPGAPSVPPPPRRTLPPRSLRRTNTLRHAGDRDGRAAATARSVPSLPQFTLRAAASHALIGHTVRAFGLTDIERADPPGPALTTMTARDRSLGSVRLSRPCP